MGDNGFNMEAARNVKLSAAPLTHVEYNPGLYSYNYIHYVWDKTLDLFTNFNGAGVGVLGWICNSIQKFDRHLITYSCWN